MHMYTLLKVAKYGNQNDTKQLSKNVLFTIANVERVVLEARASQQR